MGLAPAMHFDDIRADVYFFQPHTKANRAFVRIQSGPLNGLEGEVIGPNGSDRLLINLRNLGGKVRVDIDAHAVEFLGDVWDEAL